MSKAKSRSVVGWTILLSILISTTNVVAQASKTSVPGSSRQADLTKPTVESKPGFSMSPAVAVSRVDGLDRFTPLPDSTLTSADKLKVYFRPMHYKIEIDAKNKSPYRAKFTEDGRIRRKGEKTVLIKEDKLLEYETRFDTEDYQIYLVNTIGLETLTPGDYEFDITLHDTIDGQATVTQSLPFRIVPSLAEPVDQPRPETKEAQRAKVKKTKAGRATKKPI